MNTRTGSLRRLAALYGLVEHARALELGLAAASVSEVERATESLAGFRRRQADAGLAALINGDTAGWAMVRAANDSVDIRRRRLDAVWVERQDVRERALVSYYASRMESEQMENAVERVRVQAETEEGRRMQREMDDRYLSRREWTLQEERRHGSR